MSGDAFLDALNAKAGGAPPSAEQPMSLNNPGNLLPGKGRIVFPGQTGTDDRGIASFATPEAGRDAQIWQLQKYQRDAGKPLTFLEIASIYAPKGHGNNDPQAYANATAKAFGKSATDAIDISDPTIAAKLADAHSAVEQGSQLPSYVQDATVQPDAAPDPFLAALDGRVSGQPSNPGAPVGQDSAGVPAGGGDVGGGGVPWGAIGRSAASIDPISDSIVNGTNFFGNLQDAAAGGVSGLATVPNSLLKGAAGAIDATGYGKKTAETLRRWGDNIQGGAESLAHNTDSNIFGSRKLGGEMLATAPLFEIAPLSAAAKSGKVGKLATALARYGDMSAQAAAAGALTSEGEDAGSKAMLGAALGPAAGMVGDVVIPAAAKGVQKLAGSKMGQALKNVGGKGEEALAGMPETGGPRFGAGDDGLTDAGKAYNAAHGGAPKEVKINGSKFEVYPDGQKSLVVDINPDPVLDPKKISDALGSRGARSGLEASTDLTPEVAADVKRLTSQGIPMQEAIREAEIRAVGAKPTVAAVTRNPDEQAAMWEGAKKATPEGRALSQQIAENNAAVLQRVQGMVQDYGGVPAQGEAAQTAAASLAKASDAARAKVDGAYKAARGAEGDLTVSLDPLRELLATPRYKAPTTAEQKELIGGIRSLVTAMSKQNKNRFTPDEVEAVRQAANSAYDRMGGKANATVGEIKGALDASLDQMEKAGPAYKDARRLHREWAQAYDNPRGVSDLIRRDAEGNFLNEDNWRAAEGFVATTGDKKFVEVVKQLRANGDEASLNRLKASVVQRAYQKATNGAADRSGNASMNGKVFFAELDRIGTAKLNALFTKPELAKIATTGRAAIHMNEAVPGSVNTSGTSSALVKALSLEGQPSSKAKTIARVLGHGVSLITAPIGGNVATEGAMAASKALTERGAAKQMAAALKEASDPATARAATAIRARRTAEALKRRQTATQISNRLAPVAGADKNRGGR